MTIESADRTYIEPLTVNISKRSFASSASCRQAPALPSCRRWRTNRAHLAIELADGGVLEKYNVHLIGAQISAIKKAETVCFQRRMQRIGLDVPKSALVNNLKDGIEFAGKIGFPSSSAQASPRRTARHRLQPRRADGSPRPRP